MDKHNSKDHVFNNKTTDNKRESNKYSKELFNRHLAPDIKQIEVICKNEIPAEVDLLINNNYTVRKSTDNPNEWECMCPQCMRQELIVGQNHEWKCSWCKIFGNGILNLKEFIEVRSEYVQKSNMKRQNHINDIPNFNRSDKKNGINRLFAFTTVMWIKEFRKNKYYGDKRFKFSNTSQIHFNIDLNLIDLVDKDEFNLIEEKRIPLFIGTQFGIYPRINDMPDFFNGEKTIAILGKSLLSGHVSGLQIYKINEGEKSFHHRKVIRFPN